MLTKVLQRVVNADDRNMTMRDFLNKAMSSMEYGPQRTGGELIYLHDIIRNDRELGNCKICDVMT